MICHSSGLEYKLLIICNDEILNDITPHSTNLDYAIEI